MNNKKYDLCVRTGSYEKNGETRHSYENIGVMLDNGNGPYILLKSHFNPAGIAREDGRNSIIVSLFPPKDSSSASEDRNISLDNQLPVLSSEPIPF